MKFFSRAASGSFEDRTFVTEIYRALLEREPDEQGLSHYCRALKNRELDRVGLIKSVFASGEFRTRIAASTAMDPHDLRGFLRSEAEEVFRQFTRDQGSGRIGFVTNFLGGLTDIRYVAGIETLSGTVEGLPIPGNFHGDTLEWMGTLRAALDAQESFTMLELGAGWAPWCVIGYLAATQRGIRRIKVVAVEGDEGHIKFIQQSFATNLLPEGVGQVIHGIVGVTDGKALFPRAKDASRVYGGAAALSAGDQRTGAFADFKSAHSSMVEEIEKLPCHSLNSLLQDYAQIDLIHCDVQGAEREIFTHAIEAVSAKVKRIVIGTHSFEIERTLIELFARNAWALEGNDSCRMREDGKRPVTVHDGVQIWKNRRF